MNELDPRDEQLIRRLRRVQPVAPTDTARHRALAAGRAALETRRPAWSPVTWGLVLWEQLVLPSRYAWAGIAVAWAVLLTVNTLCSGNVPAGRQRNPAEISRIMAAAEERHRLCVELVGVVASSRHEAPPAPVAPSPRSDYRREEVYNV